MKKVDYYKRSLKLLQELKAEHPNQTIGQHIATAFADYGDTWGLTDKEFCFSIEKYKASLDIDYATDDDVQRIIQDGMNIDQWVFNEYNNDEYED